MCLCYSAHALKIANNATTLCKQQRKILFPLVYCGCSPCDIQQLLCILPTTIHNEHGLLFQGCCICFVAILNQFFVYSVILLQSQPMPDCHWTVTVGISIGEHWWGHFTCFESLYYGDNWLVNVSLTLVTFQIVGVFNGSLCVWKIRRLWIDTDNMAVNFVMTWIYEWLTC